MKVTPGPLQNIPEVKARYFYERRIDVDKDLRPDERKLLNETDQGSTRRTDDADTENSTSGGKQDSTTKAHEQKRRADALERSATERLREDFPNSDIQENVEFPAKEGIHKKGEIDTLIDGIPIEVTTGSGKRKLDQLQKLESFTGEKPIFFAPGKLKGSNEKSIRNAGYEIAKDLDELSELVKKRKNIQWR